MFDQFFRCANPIGFKVDEEVRDKFGYDFMIVPCGKCELCVQNIKSMWTLRLRQEASLYPFSSFVTLTYDNDHVPFDLCYKDFQDFMKRFRRLGYKCRYFVSGEYGANTHRAHWHCLLFGVAPDRSTVADIEASWGNGFVKVSLLNNNRCKYTCQYTEKKIGEREDGIHSVLPFCRMSLKPGIGAQWLLDNVQDVMKRMKISYGGAVYPIPRYYYKLIDNDAWKEEYLSFLQDEHIRKVDDYVTSWVSSHPDVYIRDDLDAFGMAGMHWTSSMRQKCNDIRRAREIFASREVC